MKTADTRGALLDAAEELFAERGVYGVSLGEVGRRANQHNRSTIQYHFGTREALIDAVAERHIAALNERRADLLRTLDLTSRGDDVRSLVETLVLPPFRLLGSSGFYFRFLVQRSLRASPARGFDELVQHPDSLAFGQVMQRLDAALAGVDPLVLIFRYRSAFSPWCRRWPSARRRSAAARSSTSRSPSPSWWTWWSACCSRPITAMVTDTCPLTSCVLSRLS